VGGGSEWDRAGRKEGLHWEAEAAIERGVGALLAASSDARWMADLSAPRDVGRSFEYAEENKQTEEMMGDVDYENEDKEGNGAHVESVFE
jgi:hypothetical protein